MTPPLSTRWRTFGARRLDDAARRWRAVREAPSETIAAIVLAFAIATSLYWFFRYEFPPMQDLGHHLALAAVVADWGRPHSLYTDLYEPFSPLRANSLVCTIAGYGGRVFGVTTTMRLCIGFYLAGVPLANAYALRAFGRSIWGAVLAVPVVYGLNFAAGFITLLFSATFMVLAIPFVYFFLVRPTLAGGLRVAVCLCLIFLSHAHIFLLTGAIAAILTFHRLFVLVRRGSSLATFGRTTLGAVAMSVPSLTLFGYWYFRWFAGSNHGGAGQFSHTSGFSQGFGADHPTWNWLYNALYTASLRVASPQPEELRWLTLLILLIALAMILMRDVRPSHPPVLELVCLGMFALFFVLPEEISGQQMITSRQPGIALWFVPAMVSPVLVRFRPFRTILLAAMVSAYTFGWFHYFYVPQLQRFETREIAGLEEVMHRIPPRMRLHYVKLDPESPSFGFRMFWHVEKFYMADGFGFTPETGGVQVTSPVRYRTGIAIHRNIPTTPSWPSIMEIWQNFDFILVHSWSPSPEMLAVANQYGVRVASSGPWELWRSNHPRPMAESFRP